MINKNNERIYNRQESIVFLKTKERFGGFSNMAGGYPLRVNDIDILTSEALYQACRFPHLPEVQRTIIAQKSPMAAKMKSKRYRRDSRDDWNQSNIKVMKWCLRVKLAQNWDKFGKLLRETGDMPIVEESKRDSFWGAKPIDENMLVGTNVLGRLLMELRSEYLKQDNKHLLIVNPPEIENFLLYNKKIGIVRMTQKELELKRTEKIEEEQLSLC